MPPELADLADKEFVPCIGTIETRKNGMVLLQIWQRLVDELGIEPRCWCSWVAMERSARRVANDDRE